MGSGVIWVAVVFGWLLMLTCFVRMLLIPSRF